MEGLRHCHRCRLRIEVAAGAVEPDLHRRVDRRNRHDVVVAAAVHLPAAVLRLECLVLLEVRYEVRQLGTDDNSKEWAQPSVRRALLSVEGIASGMTF